MQVIKVYTLGEVQDILKVTQRTVYNYIKGGKLKAVKMGKYWRVRHEDLDAFLTGASVCSSAATKPKARPQERSSIIRDEITIKNDESGWRVTGFKPAEDKTFTDRDQAADYAADLGGRHFVPVVWLPVTLEELSSGIKPKAKTKTP